LRILCTGDIHLGRNPTRIPIDRVPDQTPYSTRAIWERIVALAIEEQVDALLISGDLVDHDNRFFEALGPVEAGIDRLADAGIPVVAVAGNHDYDVLPALADRYGERFRLLGRNQRWDRFTLRDADGRARLHIDGWSFASEHVTHDPLLTYALDRVSDAPVIGLLHTDVDQTSSRYAPTRLADLTASPVVAWLIGHVHAPSLRGGNGVPPVLYPGSPAPLDPGEPGVHGVWFLEIEPGESARFTFQSIAPLRYANISIDLSGVADANEAGTRIFDKLRADAESINTRYTLYRIGLTGRTSLGPERHGKFNDIRAQHTDRWSIEQLLDLTRPEIDLDALALESSPPGAIARLLRSLQLPEHENNLTERAREEVASLRNTAHYANLAELEPPNSRDLVEQAAWSLLEALFADQEAKR
jgi:DNA repair exonuclease SbcCD nuclease subunit